MDLEQLIEDHAELLECRAKKNPVLCQKLKQISTAVKPRKKSSLSLAPLVLLYSILVFGFTFVNFQLIDLLKKESPQPTLPLVRTAEIFQPSFPGSISQVIEEVLTWDE